MSESAEEVSAEEVTEAVRLFGVDALLRDLTLDESFTALAEAAKNAYAEPLRQGLLVLAGVASMVLAGDRWDVPYEPWFNIGAQRGMVPSDLSERDLNVLRWAANNLSHVHLSARSGDLVWLQSSDRRSDLPLVRDAVTKWAAQVISKENWNRTEGDSFVRAVALGKRLNMSEQLTQIQENVVAALTHADEAWFAAHLADFIVEQGLVGSRTEDVLQGLDLALTESELSLLVRERLLTVKARLLRNADRDEDAAAVDELHVDALLEEAKSRAAESHMIEAHFLENAYQKAPDPEEMAFRPDC